MAESFISAVAEKLLGKLGSLAYQELGLAWGVKNDIQELSKTLNTIRAVLLDAEEQQAHNHKLRVWLEELKEVCYDAEDVLEEIEVEALRKQVIATRGSIATKVCHFLSCPKLLAFRFKIGHMIKEVRERLDKIVAEKDKFNLNERQENKHVISKERETYSFVVAKDIIGRDEDKDKIIELLLDSSDAHENISILPIVGIGGLGKTAVAKLVFNDKKVKEYFELKIWICVSYEFVIKKLIIKVINSATGKEYDNSGKEYDNLEIEKLHKKLRDVLGGKKYLLVMDDVWNEDVGTWIEFRNLLIGGDNGSKILVTTRSHRVASIMGTIDSYILGVLSHEECLMLFIRCAFKEGQEKQYPNLRKIGEEIIKKCGGVPLAVKTLGSLLHLSTDEQEWKNVRDNEIWKLEQKDSDVIPALKLSYDHLPSHLKQCFAYCSIFPKDYKLNNIQLVQFWMAHGLLSSISENHNLKNIGNRYLKELFSRSFFQDIDSDYDFYKFKMHDLLHDLASSLMKDEWAVVNSANQVCSKTVRHLLFDYDDASKIEFPSSLSNLRHVKTFYFLFASEIPSRSFLKSLISSMPFLRVLDLKGSDIEVLPKRIGNLKHLRYFDLEYNPKIEM